MSDVVNRAEQSVLGSLLRDNEVIADVVQILRREDFHLDAHQKIFAAALTLWEQGRPVDLVTLANALATSRQIEDIGGYAYLAELWDAAPTAANAEHYAKIVRERSIFWNLGIAAAKIAEEAQSPTGSAEHAVEMAEQAVFAVGEMGIQSAAQPLSDAVNACLDRLDARANRVATTGAVLTGYLDLDDLTCGVQPGELVILAARPSTGKTAISLGIARNAASAGTPVFFASLEQPAVDLSERLLACEASVDSYRLRKGRIDNDERERIADAVAVLRKLPLQIDDASRQSVLRIAANVRRLKHRQGLGLVVVDYLQLIEPEDKRASQHEQIALISRRLKQLAREAQLPVLCLAQLNREVENRKAGERPRLADLRGSGEIEQNADTVMLLHRPPDSDHVIEVILAKQRNGPTGEVTLTFLRHFLRFENFAAESPFSGSR